MKRGGGTLFWLQVSCRHRCLTSPMPPLSPKGFAGLAVVLPPAFLHVTFLTNSICWLHWFAGYTIRAHLGYQRLAITTDSYQPVDTIGYTGYSQCRREAHGL